MAQTATSAAMPCTGSSRDMDDAVAQTTTSAAMPCTGSSRDTDDAVDSH